MTCDEARELIGADPDAATPELLSHLATCPDCQAYREQMRALNANIKRALELDWQKLQPTASPAVLPWQKVPPTAAPSAPPIPPSASSIAASPAAQPAARSAPPPERSNVTPFRRKAPAAVAKHPQPRLFAFAASVAAALVVALTLWLSRPTESLADEIVAHVNGEPDSWHQTQPVSAEQLDAVLRKSGVKLGQGMQPVVYASSCWFRGHFVPHFVVMTKDGPATVMVLMNEKVQAAQRFNEDGYSGLLVPVRTGSVAVLSRTPMSLEQPASNVVKALQSAN
jgi:Protein of unknown function (DUF3379)